MSFLDSIDEAIQESPVGRFFEMKERKTSVRSELRGALCTFMSMSYILAVNPRILAESGGPCSHGDGPDAYDACIETIKREYISATAIASMMGCFFMGKCDYHSMLSLSLFVAVAVALLVLEDHSHVRMKCLSHLKAVTPCRIWSQPSHCIGPWNGYECLLYIFRCWFSWIWRVSLAYTCYRCCR